MSQIAGSCPTHYTSLRRELINVDRDDDWTYSAPFDFVHNRFNCTAVSNWSQICSKSFAALKPGGWIELAEYGSYSHYCKLFLHTNHPIASQTLPTPTTAPSPSTANSANSSSN